jgi:hypothetical protein
LISWEAVPRSTGIGLICSSRGLLPEHGGNLLPAVDSSQPGLPARHEAEEQHDGRESLGPSGSSGRSVLLDPPGPLQNERTY